MKPWQIVRRQQRKHRSKMNQITENMKRNFHEQDRINMKKIQRDRIFDNIKEAAVLLCMAALVGFTLWVMIW